MQEPEDASGRPRWALDKGVVAVAAITVLFLVGLIMWGGGEAPPRRAAPPQGGGDAASPRAVVPDVDPTFDISALDSIGSPATSADPTTVRAWRVSGRWERVLADLEASFPVPGYQLTNSIGTIDDDNDEVNGATWYVRPVGVERPQKIRLMTFRADPNDPASTTVEYQEP